MEDRPRRCSCFTGYCYRSLCHENASKWNKPAAVEKAPQKPRMQIVSWRYDDEAKEDTHGNG
jgi:hypothetical protein